MKKLKEKKGFTLVELLVTLGIMCIVMTAIFTFFIFNYNTYHKAEDRIEAQYNVQKVMGEFIDSIIAAEKIIAITDRQGNTINFFNNDFYKIGQIRFKIGDKYYIFKHEDDEIRRGYTTSQTDEPASYMTIASSIAAFEITPVPYDVGTTYNDCKGLQIRFTGKKNNQFVEVKNKIFLRNWAE